MSSIVELNVGAKRFHTKPTVAAAAEWVGKPDQVVVLEVGKRYITNSGVVVGPMKTPESTMYADQGYICCAAPPANGWKYGLGYFHKHNGWWVGLDGAYQYSIKAEYVEMDPMEKAWMEGKPIECYIHGDWHSLHSYATIAGAFGATSITTKEWWATNYAKYQSRVKGAA